ncbi:biotin/lipoyl-containing protein, partial [Desulfosporosinus sp. BICA1-9]|uniref:biotin/lipoyl-containing protein n=1 Tax=Desulfosporosinus sp. BICA1-9 TaxID=1531958 RepID=UPI00054B8F78
DINLLTQSGEYSLTEMADPDNKNEIGSPIPGTVVTLMVQEGDQVTQNQTLVVVEAMKMETRITSSISGIVRSVNIKEGQQVKAGELLIVVE